MSPPRARAAEAKRRPGPSIGTVEAGQAFCNRVKDEGSQTGAQCRRGLASRGGSLQPRPKTNHPPIAKGPRGVPFTRGLDAVAGIFGVFLKLPPQFSWTKSTILGEDFERRPLLILSFREPLRANVNDPTTWPCSDHTESIETNFARTRFAGCSLYALAHRIVAQPEHPSGASDDGSPFRAHGHAAPLRPLRGPAPQRAASEAALPERSTTQATGTRPYAWGSELLATPGGSSPGPSPSLEPPESTCALRDEATRDTRRDDRRVRRCWPVRRCGRETPTMRRCSCFARR